VDDLKQRERNVRAAREGLPERARPVYAKRPDKAWFIYK